MLHLIPHSLRSTSTVEKSAADGGRLRRVTRGVFVGRLLAILVALVCWSGLVGQAQAGCGSYITVGNWQYGAKQIGVAGFNQGGLKITESGGGRLLIPGSLARSTGHTSELPGECQGPNCSRQTPAPKVPATSVYSHSLPELLWASVATWAIDLPASGWLTQSAASPFYRSSSILRPPRSL